MATTPLCRYCQTLVTCPDVSNGYYVQNTPHHSDLKALSESTSACFLCEKLLKSLAAITTDDKPVIDRNITDFKVSHHVAGSGTFGWNHATFQGRWPKHFEYHVDGSQSGQNLQILVLLDRRKHANTSGRAIWRVQGSSSFDDRLPVIKQWLEECQMHSDCVKTHMDTWPTRLLHVGSAEEQKQPRLVYTDDLSKDGLLYTTLSHCWGSKTSLPLRTTRDTEKSHLAGIPFENLPRTFKDACTITRKLGIQYIWIDSLCIIQDDKKDWEKEAAQMAAIYQGSYMTIGATESPDSKVGCFLDGTEAPLQIKYDSDQPEALVRIEPEDFVRRVQLSTLNKRGRVLQELIFSRRTLHCTKGQFYWQCRSQFTTEDNFYDSRDFLSLRQPEGRLHKFSDLRGSRSQQVWWDWVRDFTRRSLTMKEDRVAAFAGITRWYQMETNQVPVLGLWEENIVRELSWRVETRVEPQDQHLKSIHRIPEQISNVPSWTWLSRDAAIIDPLELSSVITPQIKISELKVYWTGESLTSEVASTTKFYLSGRIKALEFRPCSEKPGDLRTWVVVGHEESWRNLCYFDDAYAMSNTGTVTKLCVLLTHSGGHGTLLILEPVVDERVFRRIGVGQYHGVDSYKGPFADVEPSSISLV